RGHLTCTVKSLAWSFRPTIRLRSTHYVAIRAWNEGILKHQDTYDRYEHGSRNYRKRCASYSRHYSIPEIGRLPWCAFGRQIGRMFRHGISIGDRRAERNGPHFRTSWCHGVL